MSMRFNPRLASAFVLALLLWMFPAQACGQRYFEVSRQRLDIAGEFDDSVLLTSSTLVVNVPALHEADGLGFAFGTWNDGAGVGLTYVRTDPVATSFLGDTVAIHRAYGMDFAFAPFLGRRSVAVSPMFKVGGAYTTLRLPGQATDGVEVGDATFSSLSLIVAVGGFLRLGDYLHVSADYSRRYLKFKDVDGLGQSLKIEDGLSATGDAVSIGVAVYLPG